VTLLAFAAARRDAGRPPLSTDIACPQSSQQQTRCISMQQSTDEILILFPDRLSNKSSQFGH